MIYSFQDVMELTGASDKEEFAEAFANKSIEEILDLLQLMFGASGRDREFAEEIFIYASELGR